MKKLFMALVCTLALTSCGNTGTISTPARYSNVPSEIDVPFKKGLKDLSDIELNEIVGLNEQLDKAHGNNEKVAALNKYTHKQRNKCAADGFNQAFASAREIRNVSERFVGVRQYSPAPGGGIYGDTDEARARDMLGSSFPAEILLLKEIAKKAEEWGCKTIERKAYNEIMASPAFGTKYAPVYQQDFAIAQSKLIQLGPE